jgi:hypothetical protein
MTDHKKRRHSATASRAKGRPVGCQEFTRVMQELESAYQNTCPPDPIVEQLKQCPEAFNAGEMVGKMFDSIKRGKNEPQGPERLLPPAGVVMPPLV